MKKKKIIIPILIIIFIILLIWISLFVRNVILFQKIKDKLSSRSPYYYYKYENDTALNNDPIYEFWTYPNNNTIYNRKNFKDIVFNGTEYLLNKKNKIYMKIENVTSETAKKIDLNWFLPGEDYTLENNAFELALNFKIDDCTIDNRDCYKITYLENQTIYSTYIDKTSFDLIKIFNYNKNDITDNFEQTFEWKLLDNENLSWEYVENELKEYKEGTPEEFRENIEF